MPHFLEPEFDLVKNIKRNDYDRRYEISYGRGEGDGRMKICREAEVRPLRTASRHE